MPRVTVIGALVVPTVWLPNGTDVGAIVRLPCGAACTVVVAVALSLPGVGSGVVDAAVAVFESTLPPATFAATLTTSVNAALPTAIEALLHETVPLAPTAGVVHDQPAGVTCDTNVVPLGSVSDNDAVAALLGPAFVSVIA